jgi:hypothetical protein
MNKPYFLFSGQDYEAAGGARDLKGSFDSISEAMNAYDEMNDHEDWAHVFELETQTIVKSFVNDKWHEGDHRE